MSGEGCMRGDDPLELKDSIELWARFERPSKRTAGTL